MAGLRLLVPDAKGEPRWGGVKLTRGIRQELAEAGFDLVGQDVFDSAADQLQIEQGKRWDIANVARIGQSVDAHWVLRVTIIKRGWMYTARALLVNTDSGAIEMDFRSDYYKADAETRDRGYRIGRKTRQKLDVLWPPRRAAAAVTATATIAAAPPDVTSDPTETGEVVDEDFNSEFASEFGEELSTESEFDGFADEGGWTWNVRGWIGSKYWVFLDPNLEPGKGRQILKTGFRSTVTGKLGPNARLRLLPLVEVDVTNQRLHRLIIEEAFFEYGVEFADFRVGWNTLTWGSATALHVVDVINARNFVEGLVDAPKVGQPMVSAKFLIGNHSLTLLYLSPFVPPQLPAFDTPFSVLEAPANEDPRTFDYANEPLYASSLEEWHPQVAARADFLFSGFDIHAGYFYGYNRFPFIHLPTNTLVFPLLHHVSTDFQLLLGQTALKVELAYAVHIATERTRRPPLTLDNGRPAAEILMPGPRVHFVAGVEHTFDEFLWGSTFIPLLEIIGDSDSLFFTNDRPPDDVVRFFQNHAVYGFKWDFNNAVNSELTMTDLVDLRSATDHLITIEYSERWFQRFTFALGGRLGVAREGGKAEFFRRLTSLYTEIRLNY